MQKESKFDSILNKLFNQIEQRSLGEITAGIPVNFYDFDAMTQGLQRGSLNVLGARPSMGKTSLLINMANNVAQSQSLPVCYFGLEMSKEQLGYRILSLEVGIESGRLRTGRLQQDEWPLLGEGINSLSQLPIYIFDKQNISIEEMTNTCKEIKEQSKDKKLGLIVIDYIQLMELDDNRLITSRDDELCKIGIKLKSMAVELDVPIFVASQLNRTIEYRYNKRPMLGDIRETKSLEGTSDLIAMLYRDEYYNPETTDRGISELIICKHRNGPVGTVKLLFEPQFTRFRNLSL